MYKLLFSLCFILGQPQNPEKVVPAFIYNLLNDDKCYIQGDGHTERHFIYVQDVVDALILAHEKGEINEIYNISTDYYLNIKSLAKLIIKQLKNTDNYDEHIEYIKDRNFNDFRYLINSNKLEKLDWKPKVDFMDGLEKTINYFKNNNK